jgi:8-oxo-dGTP pyrophosphatase MutT (NUDIX family)
VAASDYVRQLRKKVGHDLLFMPSVACLIRDSKERILLARHADGRWTLPGGWIDPGETPAEAARREIREEASVEIELLGIAGVFGGYPEFHDFYAHGDEVAWVSIVFAAEIAEGAARPGDDETEEVRWVSIEEALAMGLTAPWLHILRSVRDGRAFDDLSA